MKTLEERLQEENYVAEETNMNEVHEAIAKANWRETEYIENMTTEEFNRVNLY